MLTALAFVPLHGLVGRNVAVGLASLAAFAIGIALAMGSVFRGPRRKGLVAISINMLGLLSVGAYLLYYWEVLEPLSMIGK